MVRTWATSSTSTFTISIQQDSLAFPTGNFHQKPNINSLHLAGTPRFSSTERPCGGVLRRRKAIEMAQNEWMAHLYREWYVEFMLNDRTSKTGCFPYNVSLPEKNGISFWWRISCRWFEWFLVSLWFRCPLPGWPWKKIPGELMDFPSGNHQVNRDGFSIARYYYYQC